MEIAVGLIAHKHESICVQHNTIQTNNVLMIDGMHDGSFLQEVKGVGLHAILAQALDCYLNL